MTMRAPVSDLPLCSMHVAVVAARVTILDSISLTLAPGRRRFLSARTAPARPRCLRARHGPDPPRRAAASPGAAARCCRRDRRAIVFQRPVDAPAQRRRQCRYALARPACRAPSARNARPNCSPTSACDGLERPAGAPTVRRRAAAAGARARARARSRSCCFSTSRPRVSIRPPPRRSRTSSAPSRARRQGGDVDARSRRGAAARRRDRAAASRPR